MALIPTSTPSLWRFARVEFDAVRNRPVLLYPEGAVLLNETGAEILKLLDGRRTLADIAAALKSRYGAEDSASVEEILKDVTEYLDGLVARELIRDH
ncbi:MAG TPA: pyrroloquinoline quinone biosynthesis peptide chaperone PqqD [Gemmatimonadales bacterium]|nr:pyrroloquinoline quinone biosynthesis peptide chaperone PqqD [Gemmatimonadales bacterium]